MPYLNFVGHQIPYLELSSAYHVGSGDKNDQEDNRYSLEGRGLSISTCPDVWRKIAKLGGHPCHELKTPEGDALLLLDVHAALENHALVHTAQSWAEGKGYLKHGDIYTYSFVDENDREMQMTFSSFREALDEADGDESAIEEKSGYLPTPALAKRMEVSDAPLCLATEFALLAMAEEVFRLDGAWWDDEMAPELYSAPRGVIFELAQPQIIWELADQERHPVPDSPAL